jgi:hypothetical protein
LVSRANDNNLCITIVKVSKYNSRDRRGRYRMVVGFTPTYAIGAYHY